LLGGIVTSYEKYRTAFYRYGNNYLKEPIRDNPLYTFTNDPRTTVRHDFFNAEANESGLRQLCIGDIIDSETKVGIERRIGVPVTEEQYSSLKDLAKRATKRFNKEGGECKNLENEVMQNKSGSKKYRRIMDAIKNGKIKVGRTKQWRKHAETANINTELKANQISTLLSNWAGNYYGYRKSMFSFKYFNNTLGLNSRTCHFNRDIDAGCTFCKKGGILPPPKETITHLFFNCPKVNPKIVKCLDDIFSEEISQEQFLSSKITENMCSQTFLCTSIILESIRYVIWEFKLLDRIPNATFQEQVMEEIIGSLKVNKTLWNFFTNSDMFRKLNGRGDGERG
jgi:hypothetical protein